MSDNDSNKTKDELIEELRGLRDKFRILEEQQSSHVNSASGLKSDISEVLYVLDKSGRGCFVFDNEAERIIKINQTASELTGYSNESITGKKISNILEVVDAEFTSGSDEMKEYVLIRSSGESISVAGSRFQLKLRGVSKNFISFCKPPVKSSSEIAESTRNYERYRRAAFAAQAGIIEYDCSSNSFFISDDFKKRLGYQDDEFIGSYKNWLGLMPPEDAARVEGSIKKHINGDIEHADIPHRLKTANGIIRWFLLSSLLIDKENEKKIIFTERDITEQKSLQDAYALLVERSPLGFSIVQNNKIVFANEKLAEITGLSKSELTGESFDTLRELVHPDYIERLDTNYRSRLEGESAEENYEVKIIARDGATKWVEVVPAIIDYYGKPAVQVAVLDTTTRKNAEELLLEAKNDLEVRMERRTTEFKALIDHSPNAIAIYDENGDLIEVNDSWKKLNNYELTGIGAKNIKEYEFLVRHGYKPELEKLYATGETVQTEPLLCKIEESVFSAKTRDRLFVFHIHPFYGEKEEVNRVVMIIDDVTDKMRQKYMNEELQLQKRLSAVMINTLEEERKRFARELHDVIGQKLLISKLNLEYFLKHSGAESGRLQETKEQIIGISRELRSIIYSLHPAELDNYGLIDAIDMLVSNVADASGIDISIKYNGDLTGIGKEDQLHIYRIIQEALNNISKHSQAEKAEIRLNYKYGLLSGSIADNGIGFEQDNLESRDHARSGYGILGMKERARMLGGKFNIDSGRARGTIINFEIPLRDTR